MNRDYPRRQLFRLVGGTFAGATVLGTATASERAQGYRLETTRRSSANQEPKKPPAVAQGPAATTTSWTNIAPSGAKPRSPRVLNSVENVPLSSQALWADCSLLPGETYRVRALVEGAPGTVEHAALICFEAAEGGQGLSISPAIGPYLYLRTGPGLNRTDRLVTVAKPTHRYGLMSAENRGSAILKTLTIERVEETGYPTDFFLSFDVEALWTRGAGNLIDALVWGKINRQEYGLRRICDLLQQHRLKANFLIDFASCSREGERPLRSIVEFLAGRGHEIHMHLHPEQLARDWGMDTRNIRFDKFSYEMCRRWLDFTVSKYTQFVGEEPRVFRSAGLFISKNLVLAAGSLGIKSLSNVRNDMVGDPAIGGDAAAAREPFLWDNGVLELPLDLNPDPLGEPFDNYLNNYTNLINKKNFEPIFNMLLHSWSLMKLSERGYFEVYEPEHEQRLHQICAHVARNGTARGYGEYLNVQRLPRAVTRLYHIRTAEPKVTEYGSSTDLATCIICDSSFSRAEMESDSCPSCGSHAPQRQLKQVLDNYGNPFDGKLVLAYDKALMIRWGFFSGASGVQGFDPARGTSKIDTASFECLVGLHLISQEADSHKTVAEIARVLKPGALFVSTAQYLPDAAAPSAEDRDYAFRLRDYLNLMSPTFVVSSIPGYDAVTGQASRVFFAYRAVPGASRVN